MYAASLTKGYGGNPPSGRSVSPPRTGPFFVPTSGPTLPPVSQLTPLNDPGPAGVGFAVVGDRTARGADNHVNLRDKLRGLLVRLYARRVEGHLDHAQVPKHIGVIMDGNRRWAKAAGSTTEHGHRAGADKIEEFLGWCTETDVEVVTLWLLSTDNLDRPAEELVPLLGIIEGVVRTLAADGRWRVHHVGTPDILPDHVQTALKEAEESTAHVDGILVNVAIGYGGRQEIADAVRSMLLDAQERGTSIEDLADSVTVDLIGRHLYTGAQPDPDLVIRTSGEQRLSGFMLWQTAHSEYYFCDVFWPAFRKVDFLRALRDYAARHRRYGG